MAAGVTTVVGNKVGWPKASQGLLTDIDTVQRNELGQISADEFGNEYVYLKGLAATAAGSWVVYDELYQTSLLTTTANSGIPGPVAVSLGAVLAVNFGWYVIRHSFVFGLCISDTFVDDSAVFATATAGSVDDDSAAATQVTGAWSRTAGTTTSTNFQIMHPIFQGFAFV
jgi:hypothetical protein